MICQTPRSGFLTWSIQIDGNEVGFAEVGLSSCCFWHRWDSVGLAQQTFELRSLTQNRSLLTWVAFSILELWPSMINSISIISSSKHVELTDPVSSGCCRWKGIPISAESPSTGIVLEAQELSIPDYQKYQIWFANFALPSLIVQIDVIIYTQVFLKLVDL